MNEPLTDTAADTAALTDERLAAIEAVLGGNVWPIELLRANSYTLLVEVARMKSELAEARQQLADAPAKVRERAAAYFARSAYGKRCEADTNPEPIRSSAGITAVAWDMAADYLREPSIWAEGDTVPAAPVPAPAEPRVLVPTTKAVRDEYHQALRAAHAHAEQRGIEITDDGPFAEFHREVCRIRKAAVPAPADERQCDSTGHDPIECSCELTPADAYPNGRDAAPAAVAVETEPDGRLCSDKAGWHGPHDYRPEPDSGIASCPGYPPPIAAPVVVEPADVQRGASA